MARTMKAKPTRWEMMRKFFRRANKANWTPSEYQQEFRRLTAELAVMEEETKLRIVSRNDPD